ncbi:MAG: cobyrinate a,c-diamide synthase [Anaerolineales bacterium]|nr:cobyrinate a,c-diamide synthase [Anaerolineales bacterium]
MMQPSRLSRRLPRLLVAAPASGSGKTTFTAGLIAALTARGLRVAAFKAGPDYIDPTYHTLASGRPCHNLDTWLAPAERLAAGFVRRANDADIAIVEGVMGLFDGYSGLDDTGSTAHLARLLDAPVLLMLDVGAMARSAAAVVRGFRDFDPRVRLGGVVLNRVGSPRHAQMVKDAIESETGLPVVGYLPRDDELHLPERHLGLIPTLEPGRWSAWLNAVRTKLETTVNVERILELAGSAPPLPDFTDDPFTAFAPGARAVIAVARDAAFNFLYEDNLDLLRAAGAEIVFFSPLHDAALPAGAQAVYLCGGFPELYAEQLSVNTSLHAELRAAHARGLPIYAECGGLMYLTEAICDLQGRLWPMAGLLPGLSAMTPRLTLGYRRLRAAGDNWLWRAGEPMRGHEFHHSVWQGRPRDLPFLYELLPDSSHGEPQPEGVQMGSLLASYVHLHFLSYPTLAMRFVQAAGNP